MLSAAGDMRGSRGLEQRGRREERRGGCAVMHSLRRWACANLYCGAEMPVALLSACYRHQVPSLSG
jgi:hypothetical protein